MPQYSNKRRVRHAAGEMFDLVADVERYPEFVPLCRSLKVRQRKPAADGVEVLVADMTAAYKLISEKFTSRVTLDRPNLQILVEYLDGPFSRLENRWTFGRSRSTAATSSSSSPTNSRAACWPCSWAPCSTLPFAALRPPSRSGPTRSIPGKQYLTPVP